MLLKANIQDYTKREFLDFLTHIVDVDVAHTEHNALIHHFDAIAQHSQGADVLFTTRTGSSGYDRVSEIHFAVKQAHNNQGLLAFKDDVLPQPPQPRDTASAQENATASSMQALSNVQNLDTRATDAKQSVLSALQALETLLVELSPFLVTPLDDVQTASAASEHQTHLSSLLALEHQTIIALRGYEFLDLSITFTKDGADRQLDAAFRDRNVQLQVQQTAHRVHQDYAVNAPLIAKRTQDLLINAQQIASTLETRLIALAAASQSGPAHQPTHYKASVDNVDWLPQFMSPHRAVTQSVNQHSTRVRYALRSAISGLMLESHAENGSAEYASLIAFDYVRPGLGEPYAVSVPLSALAPIEGKDWESLGDDQQEIELPFRLGTGMTALKGGKLSSGVRQITELAHVYVYPTQRNPALTKVPVRRATKDSTTGDYHYQHLAEPNHSITWKARNDSPTFSESLPTEENTMRSGYLQSVNVPMVEAQATVDGFNSNDCVIVFPADAGFDPVYVVFKSNAEYAVNAFNNEQPTLNE